MARGPRYGREGPGPDRRRSASSVETATETARGRWDPDREFLRKEAEEGLPVQIRYPVLRTPHVFVPSLG